MKITEILKSKKLALSFEVFPPKTKLNYESVLQAVKGIAQTSPDFISVTYGAGGGTSDYTVAVAREIKNMGITPLAHLSCICHGKADVKNKLFELKELGIENILALRGDIPQGFKGNLDYKYASQLVEDIKKFGGFCIGGACYPEGHPESETLYSDIDHLKTKVDAGCDFLTTQMFFDNDIYYSFLCKAQSCGINIPIIPGIMPVTAQAQVKRIIDMSGSCLPVRFRRIVDRFGENPAAMKQAGIAYATEQIIDLYANGINAVHVYSMNKPDVAQAIRANLSDIL
ncbi:MAG: methylenetetrahydrofolate reductase [NAD(P)H] [Clostridia bacterium]|nr:methylenetetrahydrofolate reductase [NAD(P)H] [Clostridia bacterium]